MAIAILSLPKWNEAKGRAAKEERNAVEIYKELGGAFLEGDNARIEVEPKVDAIYDEDPKGKLVKPKKSKKKKK